MRAEQTVNEMAQEVLSRQARTLANRKGYSLEVARQAVADTEAGERVLGAGRGTIYAQQWLGGALALCSPTPLYSWPES